MRGHYVAALVDTLCESGAVRTSLLEGSGLLEQDLSSDRLIDHERLERITALAARFEPGEAVGLRTGQRLNINSHGALGYAAMASENLQHALQLLLKYYRVQAPRARFLLHHQGDFHHLICDPSFFLPGVPWLTADMLVTSIYTSMEFLLGGRNKGLEVWFCHAPPPHESAYAETFRVPVRFGQAFNGLVIPEAVMLLPLLSADALASTLFEKRCEAIRQEAEQNGLAESIRQIQSQSRFLSQVEVAQRLNMSVSTLHRRMEEQGVIYRHLMVDIKRDLAVEHLRGAVLTVEEIAHQLGFSDASNFRRAFVSWTGKTPREIRAGHWSGADLSPSEASPG